MLLLTLRVLSIFVTIRYVFKTVLIFVCNARIIPYYNFKSLCPINICSTNRFNCDTDSKPNSIFRPGEHVKSFVKCRRKTIFFSPTRSKILNL